MWRLNDPIICDTLTPASSVDKRGRIYVLSDRANLLLRCPMIRRWCWVRVCSIWSWWSIWPQPPVTVGALVGEVYCSLSCPECLLSHLCFHLSYICLLYVEIMSFNCRNCIFQLQKLHLSIEEIISFNCKYQIYQLQKSYLSIAEIISFNWRTCIF